MLANGEDLIGFLSLRLDDGFTDPVLATIDLNFVHTAGSNELAANFDESVPAINLANISALDLQIQKYALIKDATITEVQDAFVLPAHTARALPLPANMTECRLWRRSLPANADDGRGRAELSELPDS